MYLKQITKTIKKSESNYNEIEIDNNIDLNVYINGVLQQSNFYKVENNKVILNKDELKENDYINIDFITEIKTEQFLEEKATKKEYKARDKFTITDYKLINIYINGVLQEKEHYTIKNNEVKFLIELKDSDIIIIEIFK